MNLLQIQRELREVIFVIELLEAANASDMKRERRSLTRRIKVMESVLKKATEIGSIAESALAMRPSTSNP